MALQLQDDSLSTRLYEVMEEVGASEDFRQMFRQSARDREIRCAYSLRLCLGIELSVFVCGSIYEGTVTLDLLGDVDTIVCFHYPPVVLDQADSPPGGALLMVTDDWTYPGYVKLQWLIDGPIEVDARLGVKLDRDCMGRRCLKHVPRNITQGPAELYFEMGVHTVDVVRVLKCDTLPDFARTRLEQLGTRGILSPEEVDKLIRMGCMFLRVGYFRSPERDIEWRFSMSLQERYLMTKLNPTQHKVYILLKMIKKSIVEKELTENVLTSYHCKTCVLYTIEEEQGLAWTPDNIFPCLLSCIKRLIVWLGNNFCPNYFIQDQNLFLKEGFEPYRENLLKMFEDMVRSGDKFLYQIKTDNVGAILMNGLGRWRKCIEGKTNLMMFVVRANYVKAHDVYLRVLNYICGDQYDTGSLKSALESIQQTKAISGHTAADTQETLSYLVPWFHLHIAKNQACLTYSSNDRAQRDLLIREARSHFRKARGAGGVKRTDAVNVRLAMASIWYRSEQYENSFLWLQRAEQKYTDQVYPICFCTSNDVKGFHLSLNQKMLDLFRTMIRTPPSKLNRFWLVV